MNAKHGRHGIGLIIGLVSMLAMTIVGISAAAAQDGTGGSLVVYAYACPAGFTGDDYDQCRSTPLAGASYTAFTAGQDNGVGATTDANGVAALSLSALGGGTINVAMNPPADYESAFVACSEEYGAIEAGITFANLASDAFVTCQWYFVPTGGDPGDDPGPDQDGSLTIQKYACPEGWNGADDAACREQPQAGVSFTVAAEGTDNAVGATTDANGSASFALFAADLPGDINVIEDMPESYDAFEVQCIDAAGQPVNYVPSDSGVTLLGLEDGAQIACEWLNIPADDGGDEDPTPTPTETPAARRTPTPAVGKLPDTGTGPVASRSSDSTLLGVLLTVAFAVTAAIAVGRRRT